MVTKSNNIDSSLHSVVSLYRAAGLPSISDSRFEAELYADAQLISAIEKSLLLDKSVGKFDELLVDDSDLSDNQKIQIGQNIQFTWALSTSGSLPFYQSFEQLLSSRKTVYKGDSPECYYIANADLLVESNTTNVMGRRLKSICQLIKLLSQVAHYHDEKSQADTYQLVFVINDSSKNGYHPVVLDTKFEQSDLDGEVLDLRTLEDIVHAEQRAESHAQEKASMFRLCLAEIIESVSKDEKPFKYLLSNWEELLAKYKQNFDVYISGFSFSKLRNELAKAEVEIANSLSKVLSDVTGKLFSIPLSFAALLTMNKLKTVEESILFVLGTILVSLIISGLVRSQLLLKRNIDSSRDMIFGEFELKRDGYPQQLKDCLDDAKKTIDNQSKLLNRTLYGARFLGWSVSIIATYIFVLRFWPY